MNLKRLSADDINRTESEELYYGGKGINVSAILSQLEISNIALGFTAGFTGKKLKEMLDGDGIKNDFVIYENSNHALDKDPDKSLESKKIIEEYAEMYF